MGNEASIELTNRVERMELLEDRFGIQLQAMYAVFTKDEYYSEVRVNFDVMAPNGGIKKDLEVHVSAYNTNGQLIGTTCTYIDEDDFVGFESCSERIDCNEPPAKIRVFPKSR